MRQTPVVVPRVVTPQDAKAQACATPGACDMAVVKKINRRKFLCGGSLAFAAATAGTIGLLGCSSAHGTALSAAGFHWEVSGLDGNLAGAHFKVVKSVVLRGLNIEVAYAYASPAATSGYARLLCKVGVVRGAAPQFNGSGFQSPPSEDFGSLRIDNPNNLTVVADSNPFLNIFCATVLKTWVPQLPTACVSARQVRSDRGLSLRAGDYLVFQLNHAGVPGDGQMNVILEH